jgi:hypothetical protein
MNARIRIALAALLALATLSPLPATADALPDSGLPATSASVAAQPMAGCQSPIDQRIDLAQGMPLDCCKGHKGICGCRAGKIVCCDGTVSKDPNCTCHSDWGIEN